MIFGRKSFDVGDIVRHAIEIERGQVIETHDNGDVKVQYRTGWEWHDASRLVLIKSGATKTEEEGER